MCFYLFRLSVSCVILHSASWIATKVTRPVWRWLNISTFFQSTNNPLCIFTLTRHTLTLYVPLCMSQRTHLFLSECVFEGSVKSKERQAGERDSPVSNANKVIFPTQRGHSRLFSDAWLITILYSGEWKFIEFEQSISGVTVNSHSFLGNLQPCQIWCNLISYVEKSIDASISVSGWSEAWMTHFAPWMRLNIPRHPLT